MTQRLINMQSDDARPKPFDSFAPFPQGQLDSFALLLHRMIDRIRQSLELPEILTATAAEVRDFLQTDRVMVYQFHADGSGEVVAESIQDRKLPSLLRHNFPAEDIPAEARSLFLSARQRSIVDVEAQEIGVSPLDSGSVGKALRCDIRFRPVDPCHVEYLTAMGVRSSLVVPILVQNRLWGLLVSHHSKPLRITEHSLQVVQLVADQVSIAISQSDLLLQTRLRAIQEATVNRVTMLLHATPEMQFQAALEQTIATLHGTGGRLYIAAPNAHQVPQLFTYGSQPAMTDCSNGVERIEQHLHWQTWLAMEDAVVKEAGIWAIADLYQSVMPSDLAMAFLETPVRGLLTVHLCYRKLTLGYLSIFRREIDLERIWAGQIDPDDPRQQRPRLSFETWREQKKGQAQPWTAADIDLAKELGEHFAGAIYQGELYKQVHALNANLKLDIQKRRQAEQEIVALNTELESRVLERTAQLQQANEDLVKEIKERERIWVAHQQAEASLERLSRHNQLILNSAGEGIYGLNLQGKITFANPAAARILGYEVNQLIGQWMHTLLHHSQPDGNLYLLPENPIYATLREGKLQQITGDLFRCRDGSMIPVEYVSSPIRERNKIAGAVVLFKDITERQLIEKIKDQFVSIVSHELRTPLTSIRSTLGLLSSGWLKSHPEKSQRMLDIAFSNTNRLVRLIGDILDIERMKFGKVAMEKTHCNVAEVMIQSADAMRAMAHKADITLLVEPVTANLWADSDRIIQTLTNLLNNAIKFSPPNTTVRLKAELQTHSQRPQRCRTPYLLFQVIDEGIGIPEDKLESIFDRFQQVDVSNARSQGGTGLGLTICREIVEQHDGQIWVESQLGRGSTFYFTLPVSDRD
ncbi:ATP-binding protein [Altericista sp. CCNU0014]|uniref:ATP-binding protein n=1 Tax=Altericista sp. CCNU0014 TaxID=3082949 RepID=UPI0038516270